MNERTSEKKNNRSNEGRNIYLFMYLFLPYSTISSVVDNILSGWQQQQAVAFTIDQSTSQSAGSRSIQYSRPRCIQPNSLISHGWSCTRYQVEEWRRRGVRYCTEYSTRIWTKESNNPMRCIGMCWVGLDARMSHLCNEKKRVVSGEGTITDDDKLRRFWVRGL